MAVERPVPHRAAILTLVICGIAAEAAGIPPWAPWMAGFLAFTFTFSRRCSLRQSMTAIAASMVVAAFATAAVIAIL